MEFLVEDQSELENVCREIINSTSRKVFLFEGDLGAGKTTTIRAFCKVLDCIDDVSSPTFSLINHYKTKNNANIYHFDFYRIKSAEEAMDMGFEEYLDKGDYCLIEWPEIIMNLIFTEYVRVKIKAENNTRLIKVYTDESVR